MYTLKLFYRYGSFFTMYNTDPLVLEESGLEAQKRGMVVAWRVVNVDTGKCYSYWRENEDERNRAYSL